MVIDLAKPLPFKDETFDHITCFSVLEHLWNWEETMMEFHRIPKMNGILEVKVPEGLRPSAYHVRFFELYCTLLFCLQRNRVYAPQVSLQTPFGVPRK
ncbi:MAG: methyltransferase domain-containing protein [Thermoplasmata archaeon]|nr:methyltransferase domain-containing protein [Thermoplasmata archaeon]